MSFLDELRHAEEEALAFLREAREKADRVLRLRREERMALEEELKRILQTAFALPSELDTDEEAIDNVLGYVSAVMDLPHLKDAVLYYLNQVGEENTEALIDAYLVTTAVGYNAYDVLELCLAARKNKKSLLLATASILAYYLEEGGTF